VAILGGVVLGGLAEELYARIWTRRLLGLGSSVGFGADVTDVLLQAGQTAATSGASIPQVLALANKAAAGNADPGPVAQVLKQASQTAAAAGISISEVLAAAAQEASQGEMGLDWRHPLTPDPRYARAGVPPRTWAPPGARPDPRHDPRFPGGHPDPRGRHDDPRGRDPRFRGRPGMGVPGVVAPGSSVMASGQALAPGQRITSPGGAVVVGIDPSGNLLLPGVNGISGVAQLVMQPDGNLVAYSSQPGLAGQNAVLWASGTNARAFSKYNQGQTLRIQDDGNVVMLDPSGANIVWATNTYAGGSGIPGS
jgi:hypothetical protein